MGDGVSAEQAVGATRSWLEKAVIGLGLCPFAAQPHALGRIRYAVSAAASPQALLQDLSRELKLLADADAVRVETTLLIHPHALGDFLDYNAFLDDAEGMVRGLGLEGVIQVASFHPQYRFADSGPDDIENYTNRSPYPMLHLLREESVERAVAAHPDTAAIYRRNVELLRRMGHEGWQGLFAAPEKARRD